MQGMKTKLKNAIRKNGREIQEPQRKNTIVEGMVHSKTQKNFGNNLVKRFMKTVNLMSQNQDSIGDKQDKVEIMPLLSNAVLNTKSQRPLGPINSDKIAFIAPLNRKTHEKRKQIRDDFEKGKDVYLELPKRQITRNVVTQATL